MLGARRRREDAGVAAQSSHHLGGVARRVASRRLRIEVDALEAAGHTVVVVQPGRESVAAMGHDLMAAAACSGTVHEAFLELGRAASSVVARVQYVLGGRSTAAA